ncbi:PepSY-associated TM helix domain-containing protein [Sphingomonas sp. S1-29]|uniref:PepSY-associated TM helix domain-containing protein n=1 Tax=Sphingomonas sp. S1-29 TaxID=2991074 RepID=UPI0022409A1C|nr:PepSY-associated TM helix domain-containing protein [Sphingomonas sp. S1-29]UZK68604.1 PepSY-associated TM helix domain-containing protein [Sphingomonas sp. S1-29]
MHQLTTIPARPRKPARKAFWLKQAYLWHWISSAVSLVGLLLFAITGITLNHAGEVESSPKVSTAAATLPAPLLAQLSSSDQTARPIPSPVARWIEDEIGLAPSANAEWSDGEVYVALPRPGGDGWVAIDKTTGAITAEVTDRGWVSWLNDLHKGRNTGGAWKWFLDIFSGACVVFALTGFVLLQIHAKKRPSTWPLVVLGLAIPAILALFFIH